jgi:CBS domain containing-hemolysin-like protein
MTPFAAIALCLALSFLVAGMESGLLSISRLRLRHRSKARDPAAIGLARLVADPGRLLLSTLVLKNFFNITALSIAVSETVGRLGPLGYVWVLGGALPVWAIGLEMLPKSLFRRFPLKFLAVLSAPLVAAYFALRPLDLLVRRLERLVFPRWAFQKFKLFGGRADFKYLTYESEREGFISGAEREIIQTVLDFRQLTARDLLVPIEDAGAVRGDLPLSTARLLAKSKGVDHLPVLDEKGEVSGLLDLHELALAGTWHGRVEFFQRRILKTDLNETAPSLLRKLRSARLPLALVRDAEGRTAGVVHWEDLVRLLFLPASERVASGLGSTRSRVF